MKLNNNLIIKTRPIALKDNCVFYKNYRVTVLKECLFRIEKDAFIDLASTAFIYRDLSKVNFTIEKNDTYLEINTSKVILHIEDSIEKSFVLLDGKKISLDNKENLLGTSSGLDGCDGRINKYYPKMRKEINLESGVVSKNGVAVIDDSNSLLFSDEGILIKREKKAVDLYVFAYGHEYQKAISAFYELSGKAPLLPRFVFGVWWSRYHAYTDEEYLSLMDKFKEHEIPLTVATIDMDWHYSTTMYEHYKIKELERDKEEFGFHKDAARWTWGWTGYSWNKELFPNPKKFLSELHKRNLVTFFNLHPDDICWYEKQYPKMALYMNENPKECKPIKMDFSSPAFLNGYFDIMHHPLEKQGIDYWWIDDTRFELAHYHFQDKGLILTRYTGIGSQRYPLGFSGDSVISWTSLDYLPYFTITASNIGYTWWSHDIGGFMAGIKDDELNLRYVQLGVFLPILRLHCQSEEVYTKEPWVYGNGIGSLIVDYLKLRHRMIPFLYSAAYRTYLDDLALIEPLYYYDSENKEAYEYKNEYMFNNQLLVSPITKKSKFKGYSTNKVYLPAGKWYDIFTNDSYTGGKVVPMTRNLTSIPVLAKSGAIIPLTDGTLKYDINNPKELKVLVYNGNGDFNLYEDYQNTMTITNFNSFNENNIQHLSIFFVNGNLMMKNRTIRLVFKNIYEGEVFASSNVIVKHRDNLEVIIKNVDPLLIYEIEIKYKAESKLDILKRQAKYNLQRQEGDNAKRSELYQQLMNTKTIKEFKQIVKNSKINIYYRRRLIESN